MQYKPFNNAFKIAIITAAFVSAAGASHAAGDDAKDKVKITNLQCVAYAPQATNIRSRAIQCFGHVDGIVKGMNSDGHALSPDILQSDERLKQAACAEMASAIILQKGEFAQKRKKASGQIYVYLEPVPAHEFTSTKISKTLPVTCEF